MDTADREDILTPAAIEAVGGHPGRTWPALSEATDDEVLQALERGDRNGLGSSIGISTGDTAFLDPNALGQYFKLEECGRFFKYQLEDAPPQSGRSTDYYRRPSVEAGIDLVARQIGHEFESAVEESLNRDSSPIVGVDCSDGGVADIHPRLDGPAPATDGGAPSRNGTHTPPSRDGDAPSPPPESSVGGEVTVDHHGDLLLAAIDRLSGRPNARPVMFSQLHIAGMINAFPASGVPDLVFILGRSSGVEVYIADIKSASDEQPHHWMQVAAYVEAVDWWLSEVGPTPDCPVHFEGGVIDRSVDLDETTDAEVSETFPTFDLETVRADLRSKCSPDGMLRELVGTETADVEYKIDARCEGCPFSEECIATGVEAADPSLLGLSEGVQEQLAGEAGDGVEDLYDLADIADVVPDGEYSPPEFEMDDEVASRSVDGRSLFHHIQQAGEMETEFYDRVQEAHRVLDEIEERAAGREQKEQVDGRAPYWRHGTEKVPLPNDTPPEAFETFDEVGFTRGQLVRVYLDVQTDDAYDRVAMVSATVTATDADESVSISQVVPEVNSEVARVEGDVSGENVGAEFARKSRRAARHERLVLDAFLNGGRVEPEDDPDVGLFEAIRQVARSATAGDAPTAPVHFYVYGEDQREALREATVAWGETPTEYQEQYSSPRDATAAPVRNAAILRDILDYRGGVESSRGGEPMVSVVNSVLKEHSFVPYVNGDLLTVWDDLGLFPPGSRAEESLKHGGGQFTYTRGDGVEVDLRDAFSFRFFDRDAAVVSTDDTRSGVAFGVDGDPLGWYPARMRHEASVPVEYIWAATDRDFGLDEEESRLHYHYQLYRYTDADPRDDEAEMEPIHRSDLRRLGEVLCQMCAHVEGAIAERLGDDKMVAEKSMIDFDTLPTDEGEDPPPDGRNLPLGPEIPSLRRVAGEYLDLEHEAAIAEAKDYFGLATWQRLLTGRALVVEVTEVEPGADGGYVVRGQVPVDDLRPFVGERADEVAEICRFKDATGSGSGSGSWVTVNRVGAAGTSGYDTLDPLLRDGLKPSDKPDRARDGTDQEWIPDDPGRAQYLREGASAEVRQLRPGEERATVELSTNRPIYIDRPRINDFLSPGADWTTELDDSDTLHVAEGDWLVLDDQSVSGYPEGRMAEVLDSGRNPLGEHLARVGSDDFVGGRPEIVGDDPDTQTRFDSEQTEAALNAVRYHHGPPTLPSDEQAALPRLLDAQVAVLQGPPGTGKTDGTLAPTILARTAGAVGGSPGRAFVGSVVAPSNKAVDEVFNAVGEVVTSLSEADALPTGVGDTRYVRLVGGVDGEMAEELPDSERVGYLDPTAELGMTGVDHVPDADRYADAVNRVAERAADGPPSRVNPIVVFGTQSRILSFLDDVAKALESRGFVGVASTGPASDELESTERNASAGDIVNEGLTPLDFIVADEGSMLKMPQLLTVGAFVDIDGGGQVVVGGDHRQLPPVHRHEWVDEDRRTIRATAPHASALDWLRLVDDEERAAIEETPGEAERIGVDLNTFAFSGGDVPFVRLEQTRRNARTIADFLREGVYSADDIEFRAAPPADEHPAVPAAPRSEGAAAATTVSGASPPETGERDEADGSGGVDATLGDFGQPDESPSPEREAAPRLSLVVLRGGRSRQANPAEAEVVNETLAAFEAATDEVGVDGGPADVDLNTDGADIGREAATDVGVVAPHNAQRSLIRSMVRSRAPGGEDTDSLRGDSKVETTERFQGGERDVVVLSATAADPEYVSSRGDFVLDPRRLTVAMSRARRQLTVVANASVFNAVPNDPEGYANAALWKHLRAYVGDTPDWTGTVGDLVSEEGDGELREEYAEITAEVFSCRPRVNGE